MKRKNPEGTLHFKNISFINYYDLIYLNVNSSDLRLKLYYSLIKKLRIKESDADHVLVSKPKLLHYLNLNNDHLVERKLRDLIIKLPNNIYFDLEINNQMDIDIPPRKN